MKNGKEEKGLRKITTVLLFLGCGMFIAAAFLHGITTYQQNRMLREYQQYLEQKAKKKEKQKETAKIKDSENLKKDQEKRKKEDTFWETKTIYQEGDTIGILRIPKLDLETALLEGVEKETLRYAVGHFSQTVKPGEKGNCCVIGHRSYTYGETFSRLNEMEEGDHFSIQTEQGTFSYKVDAIQVVKPAEVSVLDETQEEQVTLITCTPYRIGTHRLIVVGKRIL